MRTNDDEFIPTRSSLLSRLKDWDNQEGWKEFFDTYWRMLYSVARRSGLNQAEAEDVVQEAIVSVAKQMPGFRYDPARGSFKSWLMLIVRRRLIDHFRKHGREAQLRQVHSENPTSEHGTALLDRVPHPDGDQIHRIYEDEWELHLFQVALDRVKKDVNYEEFQAFDCYALKGWPPEQVAKTLNLTMSFVYNAKYNLTKLIKEEVRRLEEKML